MKLEQFPTMEPKKEDEKDISPEMAKESLNSDVEKETNLQEKKEEFVQSVLSLVEEKLTAKLKEAGWDGETSLNEFKENIRKGMLDKIKDPLNQKGELIDAYSNLKKKQESYKGHSDINVAKIIKDFKAYVNIENNEVEKLHEDIVGSSYADRKKKEENSPNYGGFRMN